MAGLKVQNPRGQICIAQANQKYLSSYYHCQIVFDLKTDLGLNYKMMKNGKKKLSDFPMCYEQKKSVLKFWSNQVCTTCFGEKIKKTMKCL